MEEVILKIENLSKQYRLGTIGTGTISHDLNRWWAKIRGKEDPYLKIGESNDRASKGNSEYVWALKDINFEVNRGEVLGIIGKNGAGKSTLLKILSKVTGPTKGSIKSKGRIASLLEVGTGFHPEMTGKENVFLNGAILGMTKKEIASKLDEIVKFSGCERYIDTPVKRYSSGMKVRLAFAVAAFLEPDILVVDEVLAVGDAEFQKKAIGKMQDISKGDGRTVLFVSHNMGAIKSLCTRCVVLKNGGVQILADTKTAINEYLLLNKVEDLSVKKFFSNAGVVKMTMAQLKNKDLVCNTFHSGDSLTIDVTIERETNDEHEVNLFVGLYDEYGVKQAHFGNTYAGYKIETNKKNISLQINKLPFVSGTFTINLSLHLYGKPHHRELNALTFYVEPGDYYGIGKNVIEGNGRFLIESTWA
ncbi:ABC transporter ATP-binding protein [Flavicella marina]|uniref:ABC transporter ATP-binding protein n=1 Tax=Flavicella marina TaxID=1475951 RepID=UPI001264B440|nr:ABC transporter ATP-binding protein [Flavicella marina]